MGLEIKIEDKKKVNFESIGLVGEFDFREGKIEPMKLFIGTTEEVRKWLNKFGGLDIIEYVRYDTYYKVLKKVKELEKENERLMLELSIIDGLKDKVEGLEQINKELNEKLTKKIEEVKKLYNKIKELNERIEELELELAGREKPVV